uniref:Endonuclease III homolog n=1 Tax=Coccolithus braarudii TaxID=221442 RepID=A0A7S0LNJ2_9EUKA
MVATRRACAAGVIAISPARTLALALHAGQEPATSRKPAKTVLTKGDGRLKPSKAKSTLSLPAPNPKNKPRSNGVKPVPLTLAPPSGWRAIWDLIVELRADRTAVVDRMGSEAISSSAPAQSRAYETLISLMLSSQTKDTVNLATMLKLREHGLTVDNILATPDEQLNELIHAVGFHNNKVRFIKQSTAILREQHGGRVPDTMEGLLALPGVGPKMAIIVLRVVYGKVVGISVDTHVHRISNQLGWTGPVATKLPEQTRGAIEAWMPSDIWADVNLVLVGLGQEIQTEKPKLLRKCLECSDPDAALALVARLGLDVPRERAKLAKGNAV